MMMKSNLVRWTPTEVTYLYHIISTHKVRGLTSDAFNFANILRRIGENLKKLSIIMIILLRD
jgi:hypothetical protein